MKKLLLIPILLALSGCGALKMDLKGGMDNRVVCTAAKDKAFVVSEWGSVGLSAVISDKDREVICK